MSRTALAVIAVFLAVVVTAVVSVPAAWLVPLLERQTRGRISLTEVRGSLWDGSAIVGAAASDDEALAPLFPGRFSWRISPMLLLGSVDMTLDNPAITATPLAVRGDWSQWEVGPASLDLPAGGLAAFGAPMNTVQPEGRIRAAWPALHIQRTGTQWTALGKVRVEISQVVSALSAVRPLGAYRLDIDFQADETRLTLSTLSGPLRLTGQGALVNGALRFSGQAQADDGEASRLRTLMSLLGESRQMGDRQVVALQMQ